MFTVLRVLAGSCCLVGGEAERLTPPQKGETERSRGVDPGVLSRGSSFLTDCLNRAGGVIGARNK